VPNPFFTQRLSTLITKGWKAEGNKYIIQTVNQDGKPILGNALAGVQ